MKTKILKLSMIILLFSFFAAGSCEKENEEPQLPPVTQTGAGTFGCLVNEEVWNSEPLLFGSPLGASNNQWEDKRWIIDAVGNDYTIILEICKDSVINGKSILKGISEEGCSNGTVHRKNSHSGISTFRTSNNSIGEILITNYDTINEIIAGTFYFDAFNSSGEKIEIRDGRFDVKFINYEP
ncbi:MAG TPA: hypothetical protein ENN90_14505 [Mariniphaga anaerophila]|uniref:HmuY protein n=1 Tax=Mariniphaga anaerophila TaxID=1484053 RepID=A0A831PSC3_9BACT|nr:hypothetical protein [Mariniphaga anaerophila]